jgi:hypothetical protein
MELSIGDELAVITFGAAARKGFTFFVYRMFFFSNRNM